MLRFIFGSVIGMLVMVLLVTFLPIDAINGYFTWTDRFRGAFGSNTDRNITCTEDSDPESPAPSTA